MDDRYKDFSSDRLNAAKLLYEDFDKNNTATVTRATYILTAYLAYAGVMLTATSWILPKLSVIPCFTLTLAVGALLSLIVGAWTIISSYTLATSEAIDDPHELEKCLLGNDTWDGEIRARMVKGLCKAAAGVDRVNKERVVLVNRALRLLALSFVMYFVAVATALYYAKPTEMAEMKVDLTPRIHNNSGSGSGNGSSGGSSAVDSRDTISPTTTKGDNGSGTKK